jgi:hypothetical protein
MGLKLDIENPGCLGDLLMGWIISILCYDRPLLTKSVTRIPEKSLRSDRRGLGHTEQQANIRVVPRLAVGVLMKIY